MTREYLREFVQWLVDNPEWIDGFFSDPDVSSEAIDAFLEANGTLDVDGE